MSAPFLYRAYVAGTALAVPFFARREVRKLRDAGVTIHRAHEKLGHPTKERLGAGPMIWFHGASVGESLSVLALIDALGRRLPRAHFVLTSGTATSARIIANRLPPRCVHQFAPLDAPGPIGRFLGHWRPDAAIFVESELWPQMLRRTRQSGARLALVGARMSERSIARWSKRPELATYVMEVFDLILSQNDEMAGALVAMGAPADRVARGINLKSLSAPLPVDHDALYDLRASLGHRPVWVAASTHRGEEELILAAHKDLMRETPDLHLILAPRHPERGDEVAALIDAAGLKMTRRSAGDVAGGAVYLADTLGELGTWYAASDIVFLGGALLPIGGHNPFEVAQSGAAILTGPHVQNFSETYAALKDAGAVETAHDAPQIARAVGRCLADPAHLGRLKSAGSGFASARMDALGGIADRLIKALELA